MKRKLLPTMSTLAIIGTMGVGACENIVESDELSPDIDFRGGAGLDLEIDAVDSVSTLTWNQAPGLFYDVYRSTNPSFTYDGPDSTLVGSGVVSGFDDDFALDLDDPLDPNDPYDLGAFYQVVERTAGGDVVSTSSVVGRVASGYISSLQVNPGVSRRFSKVPMCLLHDNLTLYEQIISQEFEITEDVLQECVDLGVPPYLCNQPLGVTNPIKQLHWWRGQFQNWFSTQVFTNVLGLGPAVGEVLVLEGEVINLPPYPDIGGENGYLFYFQLTGEVPELFGVPLHEGNNFATWPITASATTAVDLLATVPNAVAIGHWDQPYQGIRWYPDVPVEDVPTGTVPGTSTDDFVVPPCSAVYVHIDSGAAEGTPTGNSWPPVFFPPPPPVCVEEDLGYGTGSPVASGSTALEDEDISQTCAAGGAVDHMLRFIAPTTGTYQFDTFGSTYDTALAAYSNCDPGSAIACNDDDGGTLQSRLTLDLAVGQEVVLAVSGFAGSTGDWVLNIAGP